MAVAWPALSIPFRILPIACVNQAITSEEIFQFLLGFYLGLVREVNLYVTLSFQFLLGFYS